MQLTILSVQDPGFIAWSELICTRIAEGLDNGELLRYLRR